MVLDEITEMKEIKKRFKNGTTKSTDFSDYIRIKARENGTTKREMAEKIGMNYESFRKIVNRQKETKRRDCVILIGILAGLKAEEINDALHLYSGMPSLDSEILREGAIYDFLDDKSRDIDEVNDYLQRNGFEELSVYGNEQFEGRGRKQHKIVELEIKGYYCKKQESEPVSPLDLSWKYSPFRDDYYGEILLQNRETNEFIILSTNAFGQSFEAHFYKELSYSSLDERKTKKYKGISTTGKFRPYFENLRLMIKHERLKEINGLNDTRNYGSRTSAQFNGEAIEYFSEEYDYEVPMKQHYYLMEQMGNQKTISIYKMSSFMHKYLSEKSYREVFGNRPVIPVESYYSLEEIQAIHDKEHRERVLAMYCKLECNISKLRDQLVAKEVYIKDCNFNATYKDSPEVDVISRYRVVDKYELKAKKNSKTEDVSRLKITLNPVGSFEYKGETVDISVNELCRAFELGVPDIKTICKIKHDKGSIDNIL